MTPLNDNQAEQAVLSCIIQSPNALRVAKDHLSREDFYQPVHEQIWVAVEELTASETPVDPVTLTAALAGRGNALSALPDIITLQVSPDRVDVYAETVRGWAVRRRVVGLCDRARQAAVNPEIDVSRITAHAIEQFRDLRDTGITSDAETRLMADLLAEPDDRADWAVHGLLEKRDRLVLTGIEGLGKSHLSRQVGVFAAAGLHPFSGDRIPPVRVQILDYENSWNQIRRGSRALWRYANEFGEDPSARVHVASLPRIDVRRDRDLSLLHREVDAAEPDLIVVGPLYRLVGGAIQTDDEAAPVLAALDTLRDRGCALMIEAHAGHSRDGNGDRDLRPRGSSALLGWPEFGYGVRAKEVRGRQFVQMVPWRGDRSERAWPKYLRRSTSYATQFVPVDEAELETI